MAEALGSGNETTAHHRLQNNQALFPGSVPRTRVLRKMKNRLQKLSLFRAVERERRACWEGTIFANGSQAPALPFRAMLDHSARMELSEPSVNSGSSRATPVWHPGRSMNHLWPGRGTHHSQQRLQEGLETRVGLGGGRRWCRDVCDRHWLV